tara:strand:+ start:200 stop:493 length:294 start_codon:yes stop_codon:yes gene_type:complete
MTPLIISAICISIAVALVISKNKKQKAYFEKLAAMPPEQKQLELMKLQTKMDKYKTSHVLHFLITIFSFGFWIIIWFIVANQNAHSRRSIEKMIEKV